MIDLQVGNYSRQAIYDVLFAKFGQREVNFRYELLGAKNAFKKSLKVLDGQISLDKTGEIQRTGSFCVRDPCDDSIMWNVDRIKPYFVLTMQDGGNAEYPLGVYYMRSSPRTGTPSNYIRQVECYDGTIILANDTYTDRHFARSGLLYTDAIGEVLQSCNITNVLIDKSLETLSTDIEWDLDTPKLTIVNDLLESINYNPLYVNAHGIYVCAKNKPLAERSIDQAYIANQLSVIAHGAQLELDMFATPNRFVAYTSSPDFGELRAVYEIDNPASPLAAINRDGIHVTQIKRYSDIASQAVLEQAVARLAAEKAQVYEYTKFETLAMPHHESGDLLYLEHNAASGNYEEMSWELPLNGGKMTHTARKLVSL